MGLTIKQAAGRTQLSEHTLRYYDREGLMPLLKRSSSKIRDFSENDIAWIDLICCLKSSGMTLEEIKDFMNLCLRGLDTCEERRDMLMSHRKSILEQMKKLKASLNTIDYKIDHYKEIGIFHIDG